jgi:hypothetical protein
MMRKHSEPDWQSSAIRLIGSKKQLQALLKLAGRPDTWDRFDDETLGALVVLQCVRLGYESGVDPIELTRSIEPLYARFVERFPAEARAQICVLVGRAVEEGGPNCQAVQPFLLFDPDSNVSSTAAMSTAVYRPIKDDDPLTGPRFLMKMARRPDASEGVRTAILMGLVLLGDRRLLPMLRGCWELLGEEGRHALARVGSGFATAGLIEFLVDWLESTDDENIFGAIAGTLARLRDVAQGGRVYEIERELPVNSTNREKPIRLLNSWTFEEYGQRLRVRLERLAEGESEPKVIPVLLRHWIEDEDEEEIEPYRFWNPFTATSSGLRTERGEKP